MKTLIRKFSVGVILGLVINTVCSAVSLSEIKVKIDGHEYGIGGTVKNALEKASGLSIASVPTLLEQLKSDLVTFSLPIEELDQKRISIENTRRLLDSCLDEADISKKGEIEFCHARIEKLLEQLTTAQENSAILRLREIVKSLKADECYTRLITSDLDVFGLSKNVTICQRGPSGGMNSLFNYLRSRSPGELETIKSKS